MKPVPTIDPANHLRAILNSLPSERSGSPLIVFVTGASGAGKTYLVDSTEAKFSHPKLQYIRFDRIGVPSEEEMVLKFGSGENWQRETTREWVRRFVEEYPGKHLFIFEGQYNLDFADTACREFGIVLSRSIVVTVPDDVMEQRLTMLRGQPELVNDDMRNWSRTLKEQGQAKGALILDTSKLSTEQAVVELLSEALKLLQGAEGIN